MNKQVPGSYMKATVATLVIVLFVLSYELWRQYLYIAHVELINTERLQFSNLRHSRHLTIADVSYIQPWMTFEYVSVAYQVPTTALKTSLNISDPHYPRLSISRYAINAHLDVAALTVSVRDAVQSFLSGTSTAAAGTGSPPTSTRATTNAAGVATGTTVY